MGTGPQAGAPAGYELSDGRLYYLFWKPGLTPRGAAPSGTNTPTATPASPAGQPAAPPAKSTPMEEMFPGSKGH